MTQTEENDKVLVGLKTPLLPRGLTAVLPGRFTLAETLGHMRSASPKDAATAEVLHQLELETSDGGYHFITFSRNGESVATPATTTLKEVAVPSEIRTERGVQVMPAAAVEVQRYASVGGNTL